MIEFIIGLFIGSAAGFFLAAISAGAKLSELESQIINKKTKTKEEK